MPKALSDGLYEHLVTTGLAADLAALDPLRRRAIERLDDSDAHEVLARHLTAEVARALDTLSGSDRTQTQIKIVNRLLGELRTLAPKAADALDSAFVEPDGRELFAIHRGDVAPLRPATPLASSTLLTRNRAEPSLGAELAREIESADRIDILIAFITMGGLRALWPALEAFARRVGHEPDRLRVLTTVFTGTTEANAIAALAQLPGVSVKVSYASLSG